MKLTMRLGADSYDIVIKRGALGNLGQLTDLANRKVFIVTDTGVPIQYAETVKAQCADGSIFVVPQGEASKSIKVYTTVLQAMLEFGMTRADLVVAVGGGVVGDMAGFAAATYMRASSSSTAPPPPSANLIPPSAARLPWTWAKPRTSWAPSGSPSWW